MGKISSELKCDGCRAQFGPSQKMYETAWCGVYWCGDPKCAHKIMRRECTRLKLNDPCNHDD